VTAVPLSEIVPQAGAVLVLGGVRLALWVLPFARVIALAERLAQPRETGSRHVAPSTVARRVRRAARLVPRATCLSQAIAARVLLASSGRASQVRFGVTAPTGSRLEAHAWLECDGEVVIGDVPDGPRYTPFPDLPLDGATRRER
jgi:hypothetical protein